MKKTDFGYEGDVLSHFCLTLATVWHLADKDSSKILQKCLKVVFNAEISTLSLLQCCSEQRGGVTVLACGSIPKEAWGFIFSFVVFLTRYESPEIALNCGIMLRECIRHEPLAKIILWSEQFYDFFRYVEMSTFDIASDAFATFKVIYVQCWNCSLCSSLLHELEPRERRKNMCDTNEYAGHCSSLFLRVQAIPLTISSVFQITFILGSKR